MTAEVDQMTCAQNIQPDVFKQGHITYYTLMRTGYGAGTEDRIERAASLMSDWHGYSSPGAKFYFEVEIQASIRAWLRGGQACQPSSVSE